MSEELGNTCDNNTNSSAIRRKMPTTARKVFEKESPVRARSKVISSIEVAFIKKIQFLPS